jgi:putative flippase GtrA
MGLMSLGADTKVAGGAAYLSSVPIGFLLHKVFSFQSRNKAARDAVRFSVVSAASAVLAGVTLEQATQALGLSVLGALVVVAIVVTPCNFIAMRAWVFMAAKKG